MCFRKRKYFTYQMVNPVLKNRLKTKFGRFLIKENTLYISWLILIYVLKKEKIDQELDFKVLIFKK